MKLGKAQHSVIYKQEDKLFQTAWWVQREK